jgi:translation initiation factor 1
MTGDDDDNPFSALKALRDSLPSKPVVEKPEPRDKPLPKGPARAVVRIERKGRGGKEATIVEKLELPAKELERWLKDLKSALGCGGVLEDDALVLQGDQRDRVATWLESKGVVKVIRG